MIDPISALAIAGNVVQFTEFAGKLLSKTRKIYNSHDGALVENLELEAAARNLMDLSAQISNSCRTEVANVQLTSEDLNLRSVCDNCVNVAEELLRLLGKLKARGQQGKWWIEMERRIRQLLPESYACRSSQTLELIFTRISA